MGVNALEIGSEARHIVNVFLYHDSGKVPMPLVVLGSKGCSLASFGIALEFTR